MSASHFKGFQDMLPRWLTSGEGGKVAGSLALMKDDMVARAKLALMTRFPRFAVDDAALAALGRDRLIRRGINEPAESYAVRLSRAFDDHKRRGNPFAMLAQLQAYLQAPCVVRIVDRRGNWCTRDADGVETRVNNAGNWDWDGTAASPEWARFWVIIYPVDGVTPWRRTPGAIGDADLWGGAFGASSTATVGTTATRDQVASVRAICRDWKPAGTRCEWIIIAFDPASFSPAGSTDPSGDWGTWGNHTGAPVRLNTARYWKGPS